MIRGVTVLGLCLFSALGTPSKRGLTGGGYDTTALFVRRLRTSKDGEAPGWKGFHTLRAVTVPCPALPSDLEVVPKVSNLHTLRIAHNLSRCRSATPMTAVMLAVDDASSSESFFFPQRCHRCSKSRTRAPLQLLSGVSPARLKARRQVQ